MNKKTVLKGSAYEIGYQHGKNCRDKILVAINCRCENIKKNTTESQRRKIIDSFLSPIRNEFPEVVRELEGISDGSGIDYQEILLLNFYHNMYAYLPAKECSSIAFSHSDRGPILGNNIDLECDTSFYRIVEKNYPQKGYEFINLRPPGTVWAAGGLNEKGLAIGGASVGASDRANGIIVYMLSRLVLQNCKNVEDALVFLAEHKARSSGLNYMLVDSSGNVAAVEKSPTKQGVRKPKDGAVYFTNFFLASEMKQFYRGKKGYTDPQERYENIASLINEQKGKFTLDFMKHILTNHRYPGSICRHGGRDIYRTYYSLLAIPNERKLFISEGNPCKNKLIEYTI